MHSACHRVGSLSTNKVNAVIQGSVDLEGKLSQDEVGRAVEFCLHVLQKADQFGGPALESAKQLGIVSKGFSAGVGQEKVGGDTLRKIVHIARGEDSVDKFSKDMSNGMTPNISRGRLGLVKADH